MAYSTVSNLLFYYSLFLKVEQFLASNYLYRNEKFERCFTVEGMTVETKTFFIDNFISTTIATHQQAVIEKHLQQQQQEEKAQQTEEDKVKVIPKTVGIEGKFSLADEQQQNHHQQQQQQQQQLPEAEDKLHPKSSDDFNQLMSSEGKQYAIYLN